MQNHDSNLEWEMALAAAESDGEDEINKQIAEQQKKEAMITSYQEMNKKSKSVKEEKKIPESSNKKKHVMHCPNSCIATMFIYFWSHLMRVFEIWMDSQEAIDT